MKRIKEDICSFIADYPVITFFIACGLAVYFIELINTYIAYM